MTKILYAIIGSPVRQVRSPQLFNAMFEREGLDALMVPFEVKPQEFIQTLTGLRAIENLAGLVITVPHKLDAAQLATRKSHRVDLAGAANVLRPLRDGSGGWEADLFDGIGFVQGCKKHNISLFGQQVAIVGAGGAGLAIAEALLGEGAEVLISDTDPKRQADAINRLARHFPGRVTSGQPGPGCHLAINATPVGMNDDPNLPFDPSRLDPMATVAEAIMKPPITPLLRRASELGLNILQGRHMLDGQVDAIWKFLREHSGL